MNDIDNANNNVNNLTKFTNFKDFKNLKNINMKSIIMDPKERKLFLKIFLISSLSIFVFVIYINVLINPKKIKSDVNNFFKAELEQYKSNYNLKDKDIRVSINGNVAFKFFPKPIISLNNFVLENIQYKNISINSDLKNIQIELKWLPLILGKMRIKHISVISADHDLTINELINEYKTTIKEERIVDEDRNEVDGIASKLKDMVGNNKEDNLEKGKKIVLVDVDKIVNIDNTKLISMLTDILNNFSGKFFGNNIVKNSNILLFNNDFALYNNKHIIKNIKGVNGKILVKSRKIVADLNYIIDQERINNKIVFASNKNKKSNINVKFNSNNIIENIDLNFSGIIGNFYDINTWNGLFNSNINISNIYNFVNLFSIGYQMDSGNFMLNKDNKDQFNVKGKFQLNNGVISSDNIVIDSNNLKLKANFNRDENDIRINSNINYFNFDNVLVKINGGHSDEENKINNNIFIFNPKNDIDAIANQLANSISKKQDINIAIIIDNDELIFAGIPFKKNKADINITNNGISFSRLELNNDDYSLRISNPQLISGIYVNDFFVQGINTKNIFSKLSWIKDIDKEKGFEVNGKLIINKDLLIFKDSYLKSNDKNINFDLEYSFNIANKYTALNLSIDECFFEERSTNSKSPIKQRLLFLNDLPENFYANLTSKKVLLNGAVLNDFKTNLRSNIGYLLLKDTSFNTDSINRFNGNIELDISSNIPKVNLDFSIDNYINNINLIPYMLNLEKYRKIFGGSVSDNIKDNRYWVKKLFDISSFEGIDGSIKFNINSIDFNNVFAKNMKFDSIFEDGDFEVKKLSCDFQNGNLNLDGSVVLKNKERTISFKLDKNIYSVMDINKIITGNNNSFLSGLIGVGGYFNASGSSVNDFSSSISSYFEFVGNNIFIKNFGLTTLKNKLTNIHTNKELLENINPKDILINSNEGTIFKKVNGKFYSQLNIYKSEVEATGDGISNKFNLVVNNSNNGTIIDLLNTSAMVVAINKTKFPLYTYISFRENIKDKAILDFNLSNVEEYLTKVKNKVAEAELNKAKKQQEEKNKEILINDISNNVNNPNNQQ